MGLSQIEEVYFQAWGKAGGFGRVRRALSLSNEIWSMLERCARKKHEGITDDERAGTRPNGCISRISAYNGYSIACEGRS